TWPLWSETRPPPADGARPREQTPCPGMGCSDPDALIPAETIVERLRESREADRRLAEQAD
ncbi:MAG: hypothetical protein VXX86_02585, partial [Planctomycetota bacterium]|nr:hypothetical protein [Planctomycetota bacterium]